MVTPGAAGKLLLEPKTWDSSTDKHGHEWVTDRYVMARRECFRSLPKTIGLGTPQGLLPRTVRSVLEKARQDVLPPTWITDTRVRAACLAKGPAAAMLAMRQGCTMNVWVNERLWRGWSQTGLSPRVNGRGQILWFGTVRGNRTLMAVVMPMRVDRPHSVWLVES